MNPTLFRVSIAAFLVTLAPLAVQASGPILTFVPETRTSVTLAPNGIASVRYQVTNQSVVTKTWATQPIPGVSQSTSVPGACPSPFLLTYQQSCLLDLRLDGALIDSGGVHDGPVVCVQGSTIECVEPSLADRLDVTIVADAIFIDGFESL
jgi:hypothetical protein